MSFVREEKTLERTLRHAIRRKSTNSTMYEHVIGLLTIGHKTQIYVEKGEIIKENYGHIKGHH